MNTPIIETERLLMRGFLKQDIDPIATILSDPFVMHYMPGGKPLQRQRVVTVLNNMINHWDIHGFGRWAVICMADNKFIGQCGLEYLSEINEIEVLYLLDRSYWNKGYATEAANASLSYGFEKKNLIRIIALAVPDNVASIRVMEKLGMVYEKTIHLWNLDLVQYAITLDEFMLRARTRNQHTFIIVEP